MGLWKGLRWGRSTSWWSWSTFMILFGAPWAPPRSSRRSLVWYARKGQDQVQRIHGLGKTEQGHEHQADGGKSLSSWRPNLLQASTSDIKLLLNRSHQKLDVPRRQVSRWFGPARILGLETKVAYEGQVRQLHRMAWLISQGRLKRVHT